MYVIYKSNSLILLAFTIVFFGGICLSLYEYKNKFRIGCLLNQLMCMQFEFIYTIQTCIYNYSNYYGDKYQFNFIMYIAYLTFVIVLIPTLGVW